MKIKCKKPKNKFKKLENKLHETIACHIEKPFHDYWVLVFKIYFLVKDS